MIEDFIQLLINNSSFNTALGAAKAFPVRAPQTIARPYVVVRRKALDPLQVKNGPGELDTPTIDAIVYAETYKSAQEISTIIRAICDGYRGGNIKTMWFANVEDLFDPNDANEGSVVMVNTYKAKVTNSI